MQFKTNPILAAMLALFYFYLLSSSCLAGVSALPHTPGPSSSLLSRSDAALADGEVSALYPAAVFPEATALGLRGITDVSLQERNPIVMFAVRQAVTSIVRGIIGLIADDKLARSEFTQTFVATARGQYPQYNWLIIHTDHTTYFDGVEDENWGHAHEEFDIVLGGTVGYEVYWFTSGIVVRHGDGGFLNWAYYGAVVARNEEHTIVQFVSPV